MYAVVLFLNSLVIVIKLALNYTLVCYEIYTTEACR